MEQPQPEGFQREREVADLLKRLILPNRR